MTADFVLPAFRTRPADILIPYGAQRASRRPRC
jgi:hypothetical protein